MIAASTCIHAVHRAGHRPHPSLTPPSPRWSHTHLLKRLVTVIYHVQLKSMISRCF